MKNLVVTAPVVGVTKPYHVSDAVTAIDIQLSEDEIRQLQKPYRPRQHLNSAIA